MNDNCVALKTRAETAETPFSSYLARSDPISHAQALTLNLDGSPEKVTFPLVFVSANVRSTIVTFYLFARLLKLQQRIEFTGQEHFTFRQVS